MPLESPPPPPHAPAKVECQGRTRVSLGCAWQSCVDWASGSSGAAWNDEKLYGLGGGGGGGKGRLLGLRAFVVVKGGGGFGVQGLRVKGSWHLGGLS